MTRILTWDDLALYNNNLDFDKINRVWFGTKSVWDAY